MAACPSGHPNRDDATFCLECGAKLALACENCGRELPTSARFCDGCGAAQVTAALAAPAPDHAAVPADGASAPAHDTPAYVPPPHLAAKILRERGHIEGERRTVTVLFIDAVGSTAAGEKLDPEELHRIIHGCTDRMIEAVNRYEGTVTQFRGDGIMAVFGAPIAHEDSARRAASAALAMRDALMQYARELQAAGTEPLAYRIGLNTGPVIVGTIGNDFSMDYTAIGDTVNLAARMEGWAPPWSVYITEHTRRQVAPYFELRDLGTLEVKGKSEAVRAYDVVREVGARSRMDVSVLRGLTPYVGRREQLEQLRAHFEQAQRSHGQVVFVAGEAGIGKSRLLLEFRRSLASDAQWLEGHCISWGANFPYLPIVDIVRSAFGIEEGDDDATVAMRIMQGVREWDAEAAVAAVPQFKYLLNLDDPVAGVMDPLERRARIFDALRALLMQNSRARPLVVSIEDLHWADEQSEQAIAAMVDAVASLPVLLVLTWRPGYSHGLGDRSYYARVSLGNLPPEASATMVQGVLQGPGVPSQLQEVIIAKAEGNPFFIEEVSRSLVETGVLRRSEAGYALARPVDQVSIPSTIQEVILSRIDRLHQRAKEAVQYASVIGRDFPVRLLKHIAQAEEGMDALLRDLKALELIYEKSYFPELEYMFKHALTQEVALSTLLGDRRKALHRIVANAIEELYADRIAEQFEALAYHYFQGEEWEKACEYAKKVALRAESMYAPRAAAEQATRAIESALRCEPECCNELLEPELYRLRGRAYESIGDFDRARLDFEAALETARARGERAAEWQAEADLGMLWAGRDYARTGEHITRTHEIARDLGDERLIARSLNRLGNLRVNTGRPLEGIQHHEEALAVFRRLGDKRGIAESVDFLQMATALAGDMQASLAYGQEGISLWREFDERQALANLLASTSFTGLNVEAYTVVPVPLEEGQAYAFLEESLALARRIGWRAGEAYALFHYASHAAGEGTYQTALEYAALGLSVAQEIGHQQWYLSGALVLSWIHSELQDLPAAIPYAEQALALARAAGSVHWTGCSAAQLATCLNEQGDLQRAQDVLASELGRETPMISIGERNMWMAKAELAMAEGGHAEAVRIIDALVRTAKHVDGRGVQRLPMLALLRGRALAAMGRIDGASADLEAALAGAKSLSARSVLWRVHAAIGDLRRAAGREDARQSYDAALAVIDELVSRMTDAKLRDTFLRAEPVQRLRSGSL